MKLALGTVQFGLAYGIANKTGQMAATEAEAILALARRHGVDTLDTAVAYGSSESVLGALGARSWNVITKLPAAPADCESISLWVEEQARASRERLQVDTLHGLLLHRPAQLLEPGGNELYSSLRALKATGRVRKIGVSIYSPQELEPLFRRFELDLVQAPLNILDRRLVDSGWAAKLKQADVEIHTRSAFLQGLLLMPGDSRPAKFARYADVWTEWDTWLCRTQLKPAEACLRYACGIGAVDKVVVGVDSAAQLAEILQAAKGELPSLPSFGPLPDDRLLNPSSWSEL